MRAGVRPQIALGLANQPVFRRTILDTSVDKRTGNMRCQVLRWRRSRAWLQSPETKKRETALPSKYCHEDRC